jgi:anaerobic ribonucleoside-triphosphate reductase activating protein
VTAAIRLNKAHFPVTVLGYGKRIGLWVQGCSIGCPGCCSRDTWPADAGRSMAIEELVAWCRAIVQGEALDGITISGGEPLEQAGALAELLARLREWTDTLPQPVDYLCYSGLPWRRVREQGAVLALLDAVIPEPYVRSLPSQPLRGSANQSVVALTELGRSRYETLPLHTARRMQMKVEGGRIWMIGVPQADDLSRLETLCAERGLNLGSVSWRS